VAAAKNNNQKCLGRWPGPSSWHITKLEQSVFYRYYGCNRNKTVSIDAEWAKVTKVSREIKSVITAALL